MYLIISHDDVLIYIAKRLHGGSGGQDCATTLQTSCSVLHAV